MKSPSSLVLFALVSLQIPSVSQQFLETDLVGSLHQPISSESLPASEKAEAVPELESALVTDQSTGTLEPTLREKRDVESVTNLAVLRATNRPNAASADELERISATYREPGSPESDCGRAALSLEQRVKLEPDELLSTLEAEVLANPQCGCEIVKSAILSTNANVEEVVAILETAILAAPESMRLFAQCAIAASPESLSEVQSLLARYDANSGEGTSAKSAKSAKGAKAAVASVADENEVAPSPNPLDFPGIGPVGPISGGPGGQPLFPPSPPPIITPPVVTRVDP